MKIISSIIKNFFKREQPKTLGRWNVDYCHKKINQKIDLSNEDHCGPCGQYVIDKNNSKNSNNKATIYFTVTK